MFLDEAKHDNAKTNGSAVVILEVNALPSQQDPRVRRQPVEISGISGVPANDDHGRTIAVLHLVDCPVYKAPQDLRLVFWFE